MTKEEIVTALLDNMEMPYLQDWQARDIVDFVLKKYTEGLPKIKGWVARYANGDLEIGKIKPEYYQYEGKTYISNPCPTISLPKTLFPELHWLDEPIEVELTISRVSK